MLHKIHTQPCPKTTSFHTWHTVPFLLSGFLKSNSQRMLLLTLVLNVPTDPIHSLQSVLEVSSKSWWQPGRMPNFQCLQSRLTQHSMVSHSRSLSCLLCRTWQSLHPHVIPPGSFNGFSFRQESSHSLSPMCDLLHISIPIWTNINVLQITVRVLLFWSILFSILCFILDQRNGNLGLVTLLWDDAVRA